MAGWSDWYSGSMAPPDRLPGGGYAPAQPTQQMSPEEFYQGIYGEPLQLTSRSVNTVPVRAPLGVSGQGSKAGLGTGQDVRGSASLARPMPNQPNGSIVANKGSARLPQEPVGYGPDMGGSAVAAIDQAAPSLRPFPSAYAAPARMASMNTGRADDGIIDLSALDPTERGAQGMADSQGKPVRVKGGTVYYPGGKAPSGSVTASLGRDTRGPLSQVLGLKSSGLGGLLAGLFGGGQQMQPQGGGGLAAMLGGGGSGPAMATPAGNLHPGAMTDNFGNDMAFMPTSYQNDPRNSNGGYRVK